MEATMISDYTVRLVSTSQVWLEDVLGRGDERLRMFCLRDLCHKNSQLLLQILNLRLQFIDDFVFSHNCFITS